MEVLDNSDNCFSLPLSLDIRVDFDCFAHRNIPSEFLGSGLIDDYRVFAIRFKFCGEISPC